MRSVSLLGGLLWLTFVGTAGAQSVAYAAVVSRDEAEVRAGPNENPQLYVTNRLVRPTPIHVVEELGNGWLKIRPPAGSFSWIGTNFVQLVVPNQPNWMVVGSPDVSAPVIVGTDFKKEVPSQIVSSRLARGAQVTSIGPARVDEQGRVAADRAAAGRMPLPRAPTPSRAATAARSPVPPAPAPVQAGYLRGQTARQHAAEQFRRRGAGDGRRTVLDARPAGRARRQCSRWPSTSTLARRRGGSDEAIPELAHAGRGTGAHWMSQGGRQRRATRPSRRHRRHCRPAIYG